VHAARSEQARSVGDALLRRTRLGLLAAGALTRDREAAWRVAQAMAPELGWDARRVDAETDAWFEEARAEGIDAGGP
jgi:glycerol-3-phosphate dehydrogenase